MSFWETISKPILVLAPMAGYTESPFRRLVREIEPSTILVSELISAEALRRRNEKTLRMIEFMPEEKNYYGVQLFGNKPEAFIEASKVVEDLGADFIDLNLGCPSPKVIGSGHGSALLKDPKTTTQLIEKLVKATKLPVTVKMRLGFYDDTNLIQTTKDFEAAGIKALAIHGRTTKQKFTGNANWEMIYEVKKNLNIPVIGNGDITSAQMAQNNLKNLDGIMIGRAAVRNPWIFKQCREIFEGKPLSEKPSIEDQIIFFQKQADLSIDFKGEKYAMLELRKHFAHFLRGFNGASKFRDQLMQIHTKIEMNAIFEEILENLKKQEIAEWGVEC